MKLTTSLPAWALMLPLFTACASHDEIEEPPRPLIDLPRPEESADGRHEDREEKRADVDSASLSALVASFGEELPRTPFRVSIGNLSFQDTGLSGDFSNYLSGELSIALGESQGFEEYSRRDFDAILAEHELSVSDLIDQSDAPEAGLLKGVNGLILGEYWDEGREVGVHLRLLDIESGRVLASGKARLKVSRLHGAPKVAPRDLARTSRALSSFREGKNLADFGVKLWVDRGSGGVYHIGEKLKVHFKTESDCYVRLYHLSANDELQLIYPNQWSGSGKVRAGKVHTIPPDDSFEFTLSKPLGTELVYAVASTKPFSNTVQSFEPLGGSSDIPNVRARGIKVTGGGSGKTMMAEATCVYSIVD